MPLFTIIAEYRGGTYLQQVRAGSSLGALTKWRMSPKSIPGLKSSRRREVREGAAVDELVEITGCKHVWCTSAMLGKHLLLVHVIQTG
jgi:hypothetical protein